MTINPLKPLHQVTVANSGTLRRLRSHDGFVYTLTDKGLTGEVRKYDSNLNLIWGKVTPFSVNDMAVAKEGIAISGHQYSKGIEGVSISSPMIAKMDLNGHVDWQRGPRPPIDLDMNWNGPRPRIDPNDSAQFWKTLLLPGGSVVSMGLLNQGELQLLYHHRFDPMGRTIWAKGCAMVKMDWMYTYPGKIEPMVERHKEFIHHIGAYRLHSSGSKIAGFKIHIRSGDLVARYESKRDDLHFSGGAMSSKGDSAVGSVGMRGAPSTVLALDSQFNQISALTTSLQPWSDLIWNGPEEIIIVGGVSKNGKPERKPGIEGFTVREHPVSRPQLFDHEKLVGFARVTSNHHAYIGQNNDEAHQLMIRNLSTGTQWKMTSPAMANLQMAPMHTDYAVIGLNNMGTDLCLICI